MRVLTTTDTIGGVWTYTIDLARALAPLGVQVSVATMGEPLSASQRAELKAIPELQVFESRYRLEWMDDPWHDVSASGEWLLDLERRCRPDVVSLNDYAHAALPFRAPTMVVGHSCVLSWWEAVKGESAPGQYSRYRREVGRGLRAARLVVAPTQAMLAALVKHYGPFRETMVIPNGRATDSFRPGRKEPMILAAGRLWDEAKNIGALDAVARDVDWPIYVAGEDNHPSGGRTEHRSIRPLGRLPGADLSCWLSRAAIYALPARYEPFGLSALEAGLSGCALVLGDIPSLREVWGDSASFVPPSDLDALRSTLRMLIADPGRRERLAYAARARALEFTASRMAERYFSVFERMRGAVRVEA